MLKDGIVINDEVTTSLEVAVEENEESPSTEDVEYDVLDDDDPEDLEDEDEDEVE